MPYSPALLVKLEHDQNLLMPSLHELQINLTLAGEKSGVPHVKEFLQQGAARRISVMRRCVENIFTMFPPARSKPPLPRDVVFDTQINLHAFVMNLYGFYDNLGWAFVLRHNLLKRVGGRQGVGLFESRTQEFLPSALKTYLTSLTMTTWHQQYLKNYRDALAHRIPLYIPPALFSTEDTDLYRQLEEEKQACIRDYRWDRLEEIYQEQDDIGLAAAQFLHSFGIDGPAQPLSLHPQVVSDGKAVVEMGELFLGHWEKPLPPASP